MRRNHIRSRDYLWLAILVLLAVPAWGQVSIVTTTTITCTTPVSSGAKAGYAWYGDAGLTLTPVGGGSAANASGPDGTYDGVVVATIDGVKTPTAFTVTIGDTPQPPVVETLRSLATATEAAKLAEYFTSFANQARLGAVKSVEGFWSAYKATAPYQDNAALQAALKTRLDAALLTPATLSTSLDAIAAEFGAKPPGPPEPEPPKPPVITGRRQVVIVHETAEDTPAFGSLIVQLRKPTGTAYSYLQGQGHSLYVLDDDLPGKVTDSLRPQFAEMQLPALFIIDPKTNSVLFKSSIANTTTVDNIIERIRETGG